MNVKRLEWENYRNLHRGGISPCETVNVICGENAQGKTNLLEALWLFTGGRSFRGARDAELVTRSEERAALKLGFSSQEREQEAEIRIAGGHRSALLNGIPKKSCSALIGVFCAVIFSPEHISLIGGAPALRRNFLDAALCQEKPGYAGVLAGYNRTLYQRNALLKDIPRHSELLGTLDVWDAKLVSVGEKVTKMRLDYLDRLRGPAAEFYSGICAGREELSLQYVNSAENLGEALASSRRADVENGYTGVGPHRDDLSVLIDSQSARMYGSQGQKRSAVLALKLAEARLLARSAGENPAVFLDDVLSELDSGRQEYLLNHLGEYQVFLTCCEPGAARQLKCGRVFRMENGEPTKET